MLIAPSRYQRRPSLQTSENAAPSELRLLPAFAHAAQLVLGGIGYLVPLAKQGERGRVGLRELAPLRQLVPFRGLERVRFDARGLGYRHVSSLFRQ